ncbi:MAG: D-sedoheptulose 7-phosphate isomerase [Proteobacteria bacterium]|nr:D-sedoheptulose 7-phosphate isomerase [Pseudomonadota bacterium]
MKEIIRNIIEESIDLKRRFININMDLIINAAEKISDSISSGHKLLLFGNGGSAADAQHIAAEFVNRFRIERPPLAALALTTDTSILTSIGNDYSFDDIFSKQILALGTAGDVALGISTSGNSRNVIKAIEVAKDKGLFTIVYTGRGGRLVSLADMVFAVESDVTARIQEVHITLGHIICELVDRNLFPGKF